MDKSILDQVEYILEQQVAAVASARKDLTNYVIDMEEKCIDRLLAEVDALEKLCVIHEYFSIVQSQKDLG